MWRDYDSEALADLELHDELFPDGFPCAPARVPTRGETLATQAFNLRERLCRYAMDVEAKSFYARYTTPARKARLLESLNWLRYERRLGIISWTEYRRFAADERTRRPIIR